MVHCQILKFTLQAYTSYVSWKFYVTKRKIAGNVSCAVEYNLHLNKRFKISWDQKLEVVT